MRKTFKITLLSLCLLSTTLYYSCNCDCKKEPHAEGVINNLNADSTIVKMFMLKVSPELHKSCDSLYEAKDNLNEVDGLGANLSFTITRNALNQMLNNNSFDLRVYFAENSSDKLELGFHMETTNDSVYKLSGSNRVPYTNFTTDTNAYFSDTGLWSRINNQVATANDSNTKSVLIPRAELNNFLAHADATAKNVKPVNSHRVVNLRFEMAQLHEAKAKLDVARSELDSGIFNDRIKGKNNYLMFFTIAEMANMSTGHPTSIRDVNIGYYDINHLCPSYCP